MLILFLEYWLYQQVTVFYIYYESISSEILEIIKFYQKIHKNIVIELVEWSKFSNNKNETTINKGSSYSNYSTINVNDLSYRLEPEIAIFDCMHRTRKTVNYVVQTDLDEIIQINGKMKVLDYLKWLNKENPNMASVNFQSQKVRIPVRVC